MYLIHRLATVFASASFALSITAQSVTFTEEFITNPLANRWFTTGNASLFEWDTVGQSLNVTWDSRQPNSYFVHPLPTVLSKSDDFALQFELQMREITPGIDTNKPGTFQFGIGFLRLSDATKPGFNRGTGFDSPNLVEFDYFPDTGFGATISPTMISSNNEFATGFTFPAPLETGVFYHIAMNYTASNQTLTTIMTSNGAPFQAIQNAVITTNFSDFRVDHVGFSSYSDGGQDPMYAGSIYARAIVRSISITTPLPAIANASAGFSNGVHRIAFGSRMGFDYTLERATNLTSWTKVNGPIQGSGGHLELQDPAPPEAESFYRVKADKP